MPKGRSLFHCCVQSSNGRSSQASLPQNPLRAMTIRRGIPASRLAALSTNRGAHLTPSNLRRGDCHLSTIAANGHGVRVMDHHWCKFLRRACSEGIGVGIWETHGTGREARTRPAARVHLGGRSRQPKTQGRRPPHLPSTCPIRRTG
jgi:hypothetical protein